MLDDLNTAVTALDVKHKALKALARALGDDSEDLSYIDDLSESKCNAIVSNIAFLSTGYTTMNELYHIDAARFKFIIGHPILISFYTAGYASKCSEF